MELVNSEPNNKDTKDVVSEIVLELSKPNPDKEKIKKKVVDLTLKIVNKHVKGKKKAKLDDTIHLVSFCVAVVSSAIADVPEDEDFDEDEIVEIVFEVAIPIADLLKKYNYISEKQYEDFYQTFQTAELFKPMIVNLVSMSANVVNVIANKKCWKKYFCCCC